MRTFRQHLDHGARDAKPALDRLVRVGGRPDVERARLVRAAGEGLAQLLGGVDLGDDARFEVEARRQVEVAVRRASEAIDAAVFAAAIGVDREIERQVRRVVAGQDRTDPLLDDRGFRADGLFGCLLFKRAPAVVDRLGLAAGKAVLDRPDGAPTFLRPARGDERRRYLLARDPSATVKGSWHTVNIYSLQSLCNVAREGGRLATQDDGGPYIA